MSYSPALSADFAPLLNHDVADPALIAPLISPPRPLIARCSARCSRCCSCRTHQIPITLES
jgi:hypothetical protein